MQLYCDSVYVNIFAILVTIAIGIITYFNLSFKYWKKRGVPYPKAKIPFGTLNSPFSETVQFGVQCKQWYQHYKAKDHKHVGLFLFAMPMYMPIDTEYIKNIISRDFNYFVDRGIYFNKKDDPLSAHLFAIEGEQWRNLRVKLTPTFTSGKMKMMFQTVVECGNQLKDAMDDFSARNEPVDIKDVLTRFTTDVIGSCAFGLNCNSFSDPNSEFRKFGKRIFAPTKIETFKGFVAFANPELARWLAFSLTPAEVTKFFIKVIKDTVEYREKNNFVRKDFMQLLIDLKNKETGDDGTQKLEDENSFNIEKMAAQAFVFFLAGYETSSTTMTFCLFELAQNQSIQQRIRDEITTVLTNHNGVITYDAIAEMKYMGQVIDETLRKYPALPTLNRKCIQQYQVPGTDLVIEKGTPVIIPVLGLHHDPEYFSEPEVFNPERFNEKNKPQIKPFTYLPFGDGPRNCIGLRFGLLQTKVGLTTLLKNYIFSLNTKTALPLTMDPYSFTLSSLESIWLNIEKV